MKPKLPELPTMLEGRRKQREAYSYFCHYFLPVVVGKKKWQKAVQAGGKVSVLATVSDEALGLLLLENSWELWMWSANGKVGPLPETRYTTGRGKFARKSSGLSAEGVSRYNNLCRQIAEERELEKNRTLEEEEENEELEKRDFDSFYMTRRYEYMGWQTSEMMNDDARTNEAEVMEEVWVDWS